MWKYLLTFLTIFLSTTACTSQPTPPPTSTSTSLPSLEAHFPQISIPIGNVDLVIRGELVLENGCLRVNEANLAIGNSFMLIWDEKFATRKVQDVVQVIDAYTGEVLVSSGDYVEIGGGEPPSDMERYLKQPIPIECPEPYWLVGEPLKKIDCP